MFASQVLPYELVFREASSRGLARVAEFAKKTGDFATLSLTDIKWAPADHLTTCHLTTCHLIT